MILLMANNLDFSVYNKYDEALKAALITYTKKFDDYFPLMVMEPTLKVVKKCIAENHPYKLDPDKIY